MVVSMITHGRLDGAWLHEWSSRYGAEGSRQIRPPGSEVLG